MVQIIGQEISEEAEHFIGSYYSIGIEDYYYETEEV